MQMTGANSTRSVIAHGICALEISKSVILEGGNVVPASADTCTFGEKAVES